MNEKDYIKLNFKLDYNQEETIIKCHIKEKLCYMLEVFCKIKNINSDSVFLLYNGTQIINYNTTIDKLAKKISIIDKEVKILVYHKSNFVLIVLRHLNDIYKEKKDYEEKIDSVLLNYLDKNNISRNSVILRYKGHYIDSNQTINQFISRNKIDIGNMNRETDNNLIERKLDVIYIRELNKIIFLHKNEKYEEYYSLGKNMKDIFFDYLSKNKIDKNKVEFKYKGKYIKEKQSLSEFINKINSDNKEINQSLMNLMRKINNNGYIIYINVIVLLCMQSFLKKYFIVILIILGIILTVGITLVIYIFCPKKIGQASQNPPEIIPVIPEDYFIKQHIFHMSLKL